MKILWHMKFVSSFLEDYSPAAPLDESPLEAESGRNKMKDLTAFSAKEAKSTAFVQESTKLGVAV